MEQFTPEQKQEIANALTAKSALKPCPRCNQENFVLLDWFMNIPLQATISSLSLGGPSLPVVAVICHNCGFVAHHAVGALKLSWVELRPGNAAREEVRK